MKTYIPDASVLLKWVLPPEDEQWVAQALALRRAMLEDEVRLLVPTLWLFEAGNTLARKFPSIAPSRLSVLIRSGFSESSMTPEIRNRACELCADHGVSFYDACYHALAIARGGTFLTADEKHLRLASSAGNISHIKDWQELRPCYRH